MQLLISHITKFGLSICHCSTSRTLRSSTTTTTNRPNASSSTMSTEIKLDPSEQWKYLSPDAVPPNVPTTGEDSTVIAPWLEEAVS